MDADRTFGAILPNFVNPLALPPDPGNHRSKLTHDEEIEMPTLRPYTRSIMIGDETRAALFAAEAQHQWAGVARVLAGRFNDDVADPQMEGNSYFIGKGDFGFLVPKGGPITTILSLIELHDRDLAGLGDLDEEDQRRLRMLVAAIGKMMRSLHEAADEEKLEAA